MKNSMRKYQNKNFRLVFSQIHKKWVTQTKHFERNLTRGNEKGGGSCHEMCRFYKHKLELEMKQWSMKSSSVMRHRNDDEQ